MSTVWTERNFAPPWIDFIRALTSPGPEGAAVRDIVGVGGATGGAGAGGGGGALGTCAGEDIRGAATAADVAGVDEGLEIPPPLPNKDSAILALVSLDFVISSSLLSSSSSYSLTASQSSPSLSPGAVLYVALTGTGVGVLGGVGTEAGGAV